MIIPAQVLRRERPITPFNERTISPGGLTMGLGPCTYDLTLAENLTMWPGRFVLASTIEQFKMPNDAGAFVLDKSTWARRGICLQNTFIDPGWRGFLTLEITNHSWRFHKLKAGEPIAQVCFIRLERPTDKPYDGKYQDQPRGAVAPRTEPYRRLPITEKPHDPLGLPPATAPMPPVQPTKGKRPPRPREQLSEPIDCPVCHGRGFVEAGVGPTQCPACDGFGLVHG